MKILILSQVFFPDPSSVGQHMYDLAYNLAKKHDVTVLTSRNNSNNFKQTYKKNELYNKIKIKRYQNLFGGKKFLIFRLLNQIIFTSQILICALFFKYEKLIITTNPIFSSIVGSIVYFFRRKKIYYWVMDINPDEAIKSNIIKKNIFTEIFDFFNSYLLYKANHVFTLDEYMKKTLLKKNKHSNISVIPPWPHENAFKKKIITNPFVKKYGLKNKFVLMYSGNQTFINPLISILKVAKKLKQKKNVVFMFVGNGNYHQKIINYKIKNNLSNIIILDYLPIKDINFSLNSANIHFVTLGNKMKGIIHPCKIYNLMVLKKPIIYFGPKKSHIDDIISKYKIGWSFNHFETKACEKIILKNLKSIKKIYNFKNPFGQKNLINKMVKTILS